MKLRVENINFWDEFEIDIDVLNYKHILLCGPSGTGKTSILNCIYYAITGHGMTNKWNLKNTRKQGKIKLDVDIFNLNIERTLNPKSVSITYNDSVKTGEEAQVIIDNIFGLFGKIGYIKQKSSYFYFINMTPKERMLYFESILFSDVDIDNTKQKLKVKIDESKIRFIQEENELKKIQAPETKQIVELSMIHELENKIEDIEIELKEYNNCEQELSNNLNLIKKLEQEYYISNEELKLIEEQQHFLNNNIQNDKSKYQEWLKIMKTYEQSNILHSSFEKLQTTMNNKITEIYKELNDINEQMIDLDELEESVLFNNHNFDTYQTYLTVEKQMSSLNFDPDKYQHLLNIFNDLFLYQQECPSCQVLLNVHGSQFKIAKQADNDVYSNTAKLKLDLDIMKTKSIKYNMLKEELDNLHSKLTFHIISKEELNKLKESKKKQIVLRERYKQLNDELKNNIVYTNITQPPKNKISHSEYLSKKDIVKLYESYVDKYKINKELYTNLSKKFKNMEKNITELKDNSNKLQNQVHLKNKLIKEWEMYTQELENVNTIYNYNKQFDIVSKKKQEWLDLIFFNNVFNKSISDMMMYTLNTINFTVQKYIQGFFDKDVQFTFSFNNDKNCIDINVTPDISILSGGEYDRLVLAIVLAFSEFFKLPLLFLDEIVNSLDIYTAQKVVQFIQQHYPANQTIIYVGHQMIHGMFESIISLDESMNEN